MTELFMTILDMSLTASYVIATVILTRLVFVAVNLPRRITYFLWIIVLLRLLMPAFYVSERSVLPPELTASFTEEWGNDYVGSTRIIHDTAEGFDEAVHQGNRVMVDDTGGRYVVTGADGISPPNTVKTAVYPVLAGIWLVGMVLVAGWNVLAMLGLKRRLREAVPIAADVFMADSLDTAFVLGFFSPRIYLPSSLTPEQQAHILRHEQQHIRRGDHMVKVIAFAALCIHWFNPLVWAAFAFAMEDMELSCDEAVTRHMDTDTKNDYAQTLLELTAGHRRFAVAPVAFGEGSTGQRIQHVYAYREPAKWVAVVLGLCVAIALPGYLTDPVDDTYEQELGSFLYDAEGFVYAESMSEAEAARWTDTAFYLTTSSTLYMEFPDGSVSGFPASDGTSSGLSRWQTLLEQTGQQFDTIVHARTAAADSGHFYLLTRTSSYRFYISYVAQDEATGAQQVLWVLEIEPTMNIITLQESRFYQYCLLDLGISDAEIFGTQFRNIIKDGLFTDYVTDTYCFVGFTCKEGTQIGWALFRMGDDSYPTFTGQMQVYAADTNNGMIISSAPATLNDTGEITDDTACDVLLIMNPEVAQVTAAYSNGVRYNWPLEGTPAMVIMPWEYDTPTNSPGSQTYLYFQDKNGSLLSDSSS